MSLISHLKRFSSLLLLLLLIAIVILIPQINITEYVQSTITSKFIAFAFACLILISVYIITVSISKPKVIQFSKLDIIFLVIFGYININRYFIQSDFGFSIRYLELLGLGILYFVLRTFSLRAYLWILLAIVISGIIQSIHGNLQLLGYFPSNHSGFKMTGSFFNPGPYAGFLTAVWSVALGMYLFKENVTEEIQLSIRTTSKKIRNGIKYTFEYLPLLGIICIIIIIPATKSRAAWLAVLLSSLVLVELKYHLIKSLLNKIIGTKRIILFVFSTVIFCLVLFGTYYFKKDSADGRLFIWKVTTEIIKDFPVNGVGFDGFKTHYMNYQADYFAKYGETVETSVADNTYYAFNDWLQYTVENGIVGVLLLASLLYILYKIRIKEEYNYLLTIVRGGLLAVGIFAVFSYPLQILPIKLVLVILFSIIGYLDINTIEFFNFEKNSKPYAIWLFKSTTFVLGCLIIIKGATHTMSLNQAYKDWRKALSLYQYGNYEGAAAKYEKTYSLLNKEAHFLTNYGKTLVMAQQNNKSVQILKEAKLHLNNTFIETYLGDSYKAIKQYDKAEIAYQRAFNMIPSRFYPLYLQAKLFEESGNEEKAIVMAKTILQKEIKISSTAIKEIKAEMKNIIKNPLGNKN